jgi:formylglycine-generating enzyme required for sulfatase activity
MSDASDAAEFARLCEMRPVRVQPDLSRRDAHRFGFDALARTLARLILDRENGTPLTIGIHGPWGSGKTSLMETTRAMVDRAARQRGRGDADLRNCRTVWFNAWKYAGEEAVLAALLQEIISQMKQDGLVDRLRAEIEELRGKYEWAALLGPLLQGAFGLFTGGVPVPLPGGSSEAAAKPREVKMPDTRGFVRQTELKKRLPYLYDFQRAIDYLLRAYVTGRRAADDETRIDDRDGVLVVFVDDLDRCPSDRVVQVLETLKLFLDKCGCVFVLGMDCRLVEQAVRAKYHDVEGFDAHAFMGKILQLRFNLPPIRGEEIEDYVRDELGPGEALGKYLHFVSGAIERNPREVKRFVSSFAIQRSLAEARGLLRASNPDVAAPPRLGVMDEELLAKWTVLEFAFEPFVQSVRQRPLLIVQMQEEIKRRRAAKGPAEASGAAGYEPPPDLREFLTNPRLSMLLGAGKEFPGDIETISLYIHQSAAVASPATPTVPAASAGTGRPGDVVFVPAGEFAMGSEDGASDERPVVRVPVAGFYIAVHPVTNAQYAELVRAGRSTRVPAHWKDGAFPEGLDDHPVVNVSWRDAVAYCAWRSEESGRLHRLPTEDEWEKAARGSDSRTWPWGNEFDTTKCNTREGGPGSTTPVTQFPEGQSPYGCFDMAGNVWEWTSSLYKPYPYRAEDGREDPSGEGRRCLRGGAWAYFAIDARSARRDDSSPVNASDYVGFRCVVVPHAPSPG